MTGATLRVIDPAQAAPRDRQLMQRAARLALRGHGGAEPNPMVGCAIADDRGRVIGEGFHRRCGEAHAERAALDDLRRRGFEPAAARGSTLFVTLEPCAGSGRTPPCCDAIIASGVARVVMARRDPHEKGSGGADRLLAAGIAVELLPEPAAVAVSDSFVHRVVTGLPWCCAKWAQTIDGRIATRSGESRWISSARSRAFVHRERGRVDAIVTGIGTALADDPKLTARGVRRRRIARRVVIDPMLRLPISSALLATLDSAPLTIAVSAEQVAEPRRREFLEQVCGIMPPAAAGAAIEIVTLPPFVGGSGASLDLRVLWRHLVDAHAVSTILVEAGPRTVRTLIEQDLLEEALVFIAPILIGDQQARACVEGMGGDAMGISHLADATRFALADLRRRGGDVMARWRRVR